jgi:uncharacterized SAM-binding protein YcdF (DUF218 family)
MAAYYFKRVVEALVFPPGLFALAALAMSVLMFKWKHKGSGVLSLLLGIAIWALSMPLTSDALFGRLEAGLHIPKAPKGDVIVMLGGGAEAMAQDMTGPGVPDPEDMTRIVTTARLQRALGLPVIVSGGGSRGGGLPEADIAARILRDLDVPPEKIMTENRSRDTGDNARLTREICLENGFKKLIIVTSAVHMKRAAMIFKKAGLDAIQYPAGFRTGRKTELTPLDFLPNSVLLPMALHEYIGYAWYSLFFND